MNPDFEIRPEQSADVAAVRYVNEQAFEGPDEARIVDLLRERRKALISLVAIAGEQVVGHILFSPVTIEPDNDSLRLIGLAPMAVLPGQQRRGIGSALVEAGLQRCRELGFDAVVVLGHPEYYPRFGFTRAGAFGLTNEYEADEAFMVLELRSGCLKGIQGLAKYASEFGEAEG
ncbi:GNAT family N-acetyltransferase [Candidatus Neomarinimicrobiota bacterium]